ILLSMLSSQKWPIASSPPIAVRKTVPQTAAIFVQVIRSDTSFLSTRTLKSSMSTDGSLPNVPVGLGRLRLTGGGSSSGGSGGSAILIFNPLYRSGDPFRLGLIAVDSPKLPQMATAFGLVSSVDTVVSNEYDSRHAHPARYVRKR